MGCAVGGQEGWVIFKGSPYPVVANSKVLCSWTIISDISRKIYLFISIFFSNFLPTLFFLSSPLSLSELYSFIYLKYLALTLCKAHMLSAIGYLKMNPLDIEAGRFEIHKYIKSSKLSQRSNRTESGCWTWNFQPADSKLEPCIPMCKRSS